jgi:diamine N-acetyltransferase
LDDTYNELTFLVIPTAPALRRGGVRLKGRVMTRYNVDQVVFLRGRKVHLRPFDKISDLDTAMRWINDPEIRRVIGSGPTPTTRNIEGEWFDRMGKDQRNIVLAISVRTTLIGSIGLHKINWIDRTAEVGILIGEKKQWGKGYGHDATQTLQRYAFHDLNLRKLYWVALEQNKRSLSLAQRCGFQQEGRRTRHMFREGRYQDVIDLAVFREDWERTLIQ